MPYFWRCEMKFFNNVKVLSSLREISKVLEIISTAFRIFAFLLVILQGFLLVKETKDSIKNQ